MYEKEKTAVDNAWSRPAVRDHIRGIVISKHRVQDTKTKFTGCFFDAVFKTQCSKLKTPPVLYDQTQNKIYGLLF